MTTNGKGPLATASGSGAGSAASPGSTASGGSATGVGARPGSLVSAVERAGRVSGRRTPSDGAVGDDIRGARAGLSEWLTAGREARGWTRDHVARVTRIPMRTLENLEDGRWSELPADVFVRGFLRSYARCVGLSIDDALAQYSGCGFAAAPVASAQAHALLDSMAPLTAVAPRSASATPITSQPRILGPADASASGSMPALRASGSMRAMTAADVGDAATSSSALPVARVSQTMPAHGVLPQTVRAQTRSETVPAARPSKSMRAVTAADVISDAVISEAVISDAVTREAMTAASAAQAMETIGLPAAGPRRRHKRPATIVNEAGSRERDARGRFIRKSVEMAAVADPTLDEPVQLALGSVNRRGIEAGADDAPDARTSAASERRAAAQFEADLAAVDEVVADQSAFATAVDALALADDDAALDGSPMAFSRSRTDVMTAPSTSVTATASTTVTPPAGVARFIPTPRRSVPMAAPSLVIDDDDPDDAERAREQRAQAHKDGGWRSFLPPALLDQERGGRQGGLTLAVIILLIVATLTLSYLMRRPSSTGEGVTRAPATQPAADRLG